MLLWLTLFLLLPYIKIFRDATVQRLQSIIQELEESLVWFLFKYAIVLEIMHKMKYVV